MFKKTSVAVVAALMLAGAAHANQTIENANNQATVSIGNHDLQYHEIDTQGLTNGGYLDSETGGQPAIKFGVVRQGEMFGIHDAYVSASASYAKGTTNYDGYLQGGGVLIPFTNTTDSTTTDVNLRVGKGFTFAGAPNLQVTPFVGYSYHNWVRDMRGQYGYKEVYSHHAAEIGVMGQYAFTSQLVGSADVSFGRTFSAQMTTDGFDAFKLGAKAQTSVGLGLDYAVNRAWHINGSYRLTQFKYGQSAVNTSADGTMAALEPDSKSTVQEVMVGVGYQF